MKKALLPLCFLLIGALSLQAQDSVNVTFKVNMKVPIAKKTFNPASDVVTIPGDFNNWLNEPPENTSKTMSDSSAVDAVKDSIYTKVIRLEKGKGYGYKFNIGLGWDGKDESNNRSINTPTADSTVTVLYNDEVMPSGDSAAVTFEVDMQLPAQQIANFPTTKKVYVAGSFTDWQNSAFELTDPNNDSVYTGTTKIPSGQTIGFKFIYADGPPTAGTQWESIPDRSAWITDEPQTISKFWNDSDPNLQLGNGNILFKIDMSVADELGIFDPDADSVQVRGSFNGWNDSQPEKSKMNQDALNPNLWFLEVPFTATPINDTIAYKYFFAGYTNTGWEVTIGKQLKQDNDRNRFSVFEGKDDQELPVVYFEDIRPEYVIPSGTSVSVKFSVNMASVEGFNSASDTVVWVPQQPMFYALNGLNWDAKGDLRVLKLTDPDNDHIYEGTLIVNGPAFNGFLYNYGYVNGTGLVQEKGSQGQLRKRYVGQSEGARKFDSPWTMPVDVWSDDIDKPEEDGPQGLTSVRQEMAIAETYELSQNYPNPFNPSTSIKFQIPKDGFVTLQVFNILGQEVATLVNGNLKSGSYNVTFDAKSLASGMYLYRVAAGNFVETKKMLLMK